MKHVRPLLLAFSTLALLISACSQPADIQTPSLEAQFGTTANDSATSVAANSAHTYVYAAGVTGAAWDKVFLRRYNRDGSLAWQRSSGTLGGDAGIGGVGTDAAGNAYLAYNSTSDMLSKLDKSGSLLWRKQLTEADMRYERTSVGAFAADGAGNSYVALLSAVSLDDAWFDNGSSLRKYDTTGKLLWERTFGEYEASFSDLAVAPDGSLYSASRKNDQETWLTRYSASGETLWQVRVDSSFYPSVAVGGGAVYVAGSTGSSLLTKYSTTGVRQWQRVITPSVFVYGGDISADASGNVYLAGSNDAMNAGEGDSDLLVRKYTAAGALSWSYQLRVSGTNENTFGVVARTTGELYAVGATDGKVNGKNNGGVDAFLLRLSGQGGKIWSR